MQLSAMHRSVSLQPGFLLVTRNGLEFPMQVRKAFSHMRLMDLPSSIGARSVAEDIGFHFPGTIYCRLGILALFTGQGIEQSPRKQIAVIPDTAKRSGTTSTLFGRGKKSVSAIPTTVVSARTHC